MIYPSPFENKAYFIQRIKDAMKFRLQTLFPVDRVHPVPDAIIIQNKSMKKNWFYVNNTTTLRDFIVLAGATVNINSLRFHCVYCRLFSAKTNTFTTGLPFAELDTKRILSCIKDHENTKYHKAACSKYELLVTKHSADIDHHENEDIFTVELNRNL